jgi:hypothetical protein
VAVGYEGRCVVVGSRGCAGLGAAGEERWEARRIKENTERDDVETYGKKLHAEFGRLATRVKISEMSRCWTLVSWVLMSMKAQC